MCPTRNTYYFMADGLGSVRNLVSSAQSVVNFYDYTAFGESLSVSEQVSNRYRFTSREWDSESSTYHYRARQYNPSAGRFTARDPIGYLAGLNLYSYVKNNPINWLDPYGYKMCAEGDEEDEPTPPSDDDYNKPQGSGGSHKPPDIEVRKGKTTTHRKIKCYEEFWVSALIVVEYSSRSKCVDLANQGETKKSCEQAQKMAEDAAKEKCKALRQGIRYSFQWASWDCADTFYIAPGDPPPPTSMKCEWEVYAYCYIEL